MKILQVAFLLLFNYLDSLPKLFYQTEFPQINLMLNAIFQGVVFEVLFPHSSRALFVGFCIHLLLTLKVLNF